MRLCLLMSLLFPSLLLGTPRTVLAEEPYFSKELGLKLKFVRARYLYHGEAVFFPALQITEISETSILNKALVLPIEEINDFIPQFINPVTNDELINSGVLPVQVDDLLILHDFIELKSLDADTAESMGASHPDLISGHYFVKSSDVGLVGSAFIDRTLAQLPIFSVKSARDYLRLSLAASPRYQYREELPFFRFRIARPIPQGSPYHASTSVRFTESGGSNESLEGPAAILPSPPTRRERTSQPVFESPNPFCELQFQNVFKEQPGNRCKNISRDFTAQNFSASQAYNPVELGFWTAVIAGSLLGGGGPKIDEDFEEDGKKCRYRVGRHTEPNYLGNAAPEYDYVYKECD